MIMNIITCMDLQAINMVSGIHKYLLQFKEHQILTNKCNIIMNHVKHFCSDIIPHDKTEIKMELLQKILPLKLEEYYITPFSLKNGTLK